MTFEDLEETEPGSSVYERRLAEWVAERLETGEPIDAEAYAAEHPGDPELAGRLGRIAQAVGRLTVRAEKTELDPGFTSCVWGDFRTLRVIGRGGMGVVYEAIQLSLNRRVALKMLPSASADDPKRIRRFQVEAQAAACLNHPHIVPIHMVGSEHGTHFIAMRLIEGKTLAEILAKGSAFTPREVASMVRQAAEALQHAHEQGVIHRDIKPSNLLVDHSSHIWVADFGLARIGATGDLTMTGDVVGTLRYASPEQALGVRAVVDHRTDIYSLGCTLYEWLALRPAFREDDRLELLQKIVTEDPPPLRRVKPGLARDLETIVLKAMAKHPSDRYSTAGEMAADLGRFLNDQPIRAKPPGRLERALKWSRRHKPAVTAAAVILVSGIVGLGIVGTLRVEMLRKHNQELKTALDRADRHERATNRLFYDSQMRLAQQSLDSGQAEFAQEVLARMHPEPGGNDERGFEWHLLRGLVHREVSGLEAIAHELKVAPDGRTLGFTSESGTVWFWNLASWKEIRRSEPSPSVAGSIKVSSDGRFFVSWSTHPEHQDELILWDAATGRQLGKVPVSGGPVSDVAFSADSHTLALRVEPAFGHLKRRVEFWDLSQGITRPKRGADSLDVEFAAFSETSRFITADRSGAIEIRDTAAGQVERSFRIPEGTIEGLALAPEARILAVTRQGSTTFWNLDVNRPTGSINVLPDQDIRFSSSGNQALCHTRDRRRAVDFALYTDIRTKPRRVPMEGFEGRDVFFAFSPDGKTLAAGGVKLPVTLWETASGRKLSRFPFRTDSVGTMTFTPDGRSLIFSSSDERIRSWHFAQQGEPERTLKATSAEVWALAYTPDGSTLISASDDHTIRLWDPTAGRVKSTLIGHSALVTSIAVSTDGKLLASASFDNTVRLWELPGGKPISVFRGHTDSVRSVAISSDGSLIGSAGSDKTVRIWDARSGECRRICRGHSDVVRDLEFQPNGKIAISSSDDETLRVWSLQEGRELRSLPCPKHNSMLGFSPDGTRLASGDDWGNVTIWDAATWTRRTSVKGSDAPVWGLAFSPDGRCLAAACGDSKVRLWDPETGQMTLVLDGHRQRVNTVSFSPDGKSLPSGSHDGSIKVWLAREMGSR